MKPLRLTKDTLMRLDEESGLTEAVAGGITPGQTATDAPTCNLSITATTTTTVKGNNLVCHIITAGS